MGKSFSKLFDKWFGLQDMRVRALPLPSPCVRQLLDDLSSPSGLRGWS